MTAIAFYWPESGRLEAYGCFPGTPSLLVRGKADHVDRRYENMHKRGELFIYPGKAPNNKKFLAPDGRAD